MDQGEDHKRHREGFQGGEETDKANDLLFNNTQSIERIDYAILNHLNEQWGKKPLKEFTQNLHKMLDTTRNGYIIDIRGHFLF